MNLKTIVQGFGAAILVLILRVWPHLSQLPSRRSITASCPCRAWSGASSSTWWSLTLLAALLFRYLQKSETGLRTVRLGFVAAELAAALVTAVAAMRRAPIPYLSPSTAVLSSFCWLRCCCAGCGLLDYRRAVRGFRVLLVLGGCCMVWMIPELFYQGCGRSGQTAVPVTHPALWSPIEAIRQPMPAGSCGFFSTSFPMTRPSSIDFPGLPCPPLTSSRARASCSPI